MIDGMTFRSFAIVPAAGLSRRMGAAKLTLPIAGRPLISHVLASWSASGVTRTVVVVRAGDQQLIEICRRFDVDLVTPARPPRDMKASVLLALDHIAATYVPAARDAWLLAPADMPRLSPQVIDAVLRAYNPRDPAAVAPAFDGRRGHPLLLPWSRAASVEQLGRHEGVNALLVGMRARETAWPDASILEDLDTPAELARFS